MIGLVALAGLDWACGREAADESRLRLRIEI